MASTLRRAGDRAQRVSTLELFFDLVFVFAITQTSHLLLEHLTWTGAAQTALVLLVVWWSWNFSTWAMNELDPELPPVRVLLLVLMLLGLLMAVAIPEAWGDRALLFAGTYVAVQLLRHGFMTFVAAGPGTVERERAGRILAWFAAAGVLWVAGALAEGSARTVLWCVALVVDLGGPLALYWLPGRGRSPAAAWDVGAAHFAERFQLFVIIALGETIVLTGATAAEHALDLAAVTAVVVAFASTAALWWLYFSSIAVLTESRLHGSGDDRTTVARDIFTYLHAVLVAGIVVSAVGDEVVLAHPTEALETPALVATVAGPILYLLAQDLIRLRNTGTLSPSRTTAIGACLVVGLLGTALPALAVGALLVAVLVAVAGYDGWRRRHRMGPTMRAALARED
ncbi:low temperature requirement protein A [Patulibacter sp. SYSU D01012]|uniref:low temperature requirement protein A n=1 Tax=Patulibacter sp. SYSU D01012 TaxID=2817381 RepID=UPI001B30AAFE|nr:low temperature requirement protein A [Patulibacter sp. SYSU D01012]